MTYTLDFALTLGTGKAGLADLRAQLIDSSGAHVGSAISTGFVEIGSGCYLWHASIPDAHRGGVTFYSHTSPATILAFGAINPEDAERVAVALPNAVAGSAGGLPVLGENATGISFAGQVAVTASAPGEGALHIVNSDQSGVGMYVEGGNTGQVNAGGLTGQHNIGGTIGQYNENADGDDGLRPTEMRDVRDAMKLAPSSGDPAAGSVDQYLHDILEQPSGIYSETITVQDGDGTPLDGAFIQMATDSVFSNVIRSGYTNNLGQWVFQCDATGSYYGRAELAGKNVGTFTVVIA